MTVDLIFIAYNKVEYTKLALPLLLADETEEFNLTIWDNDSKDGTKEYLSTLNDERIVRKVFSKDNVGLRGAVNELFSTSSADLVGIIPNDFLVTPGWTRPLVRAHADIPELGMIACWHFCPEDFDYEKAKDKIQKFGQHQVLRHPWTGGGAGLVKLKTVRECGLLESNSTTKYWIRMALRGYINGFYFPLIYVEHMDDPRSPNTLLKTDDDLKKYFPVSAGIFGVCSLGEFSQVIRRQALLIQTASYDPKKYVRWRLKFRRLLDKIFK